MANLNHTPNPELHNPQVDGQAFFWQAGPVGILLSHGFTATAAEVRPFARLLHELGYTVAGPLLPGHGTSPSDLNSTRWQDWYAAYDATYSQLRDCCETVFTGGESMGGCLALQHAIQHPETDGVLLYAPALKLHVTATDRLRLRLMAPFTLAVPKVNLKDATPHPWQGYPVNPLKGILELLKLQDVIRPKLSQIHQPMLVIHGRLDLSVHPDTPEIIARGVSSELVEVHWLEHTAHTVILDRELDKVLEISLAFIERSQHPGH
jgi:carboxylesterase